MFKMAEITAHARNTLERNSWPVITWMGKPSALG